MKMQACKKEPQAFHLRLLKVLAMADNLQIKFKYFDYDTKKQRRYLKKGEYYFVSPWRMLYIDDHYYLLAWDSKDQKFKNFRVEKMEDVTSVDASGIPVLREGEEEFRKIDMSACSKYTFNMFGGEVETVTMAFQNHLMGTVFDRFGRDVVVFKQDEKHFRITVPVAVSPQFFGWVFGLGKAVRIVSPEDVKEKYKAALAEIIGRYED